MCKNHLNALLYDKLFANARKMTKSANCKKYQKWAVMEPILCHTNILIEKAMEMSQMNYEYCDGVTHTIKKGDTLYEISRKYNVALALLLRANPYVDVFNLQVGDTICIPTTQNQMTPYPVSSMAPETPAAANAARQGETQGKAEGSSCTMSMKEEANAANVVPLPENSGETKGEVFEEEKMEAGAQRNMSSDCWEKYVVNPGDTMADVLRDMDGDIEKFLERNDISTIYMLPGVAYYICK